MDSLVRMKIVQSHHEPISSANDLNPSQRSSAATVTIAQPRHSSPAVERMAN